jgi:hypothetical protein
MNIRKILYEITDNSKVLTENLELQEFLDSYTLIEFFSNLEDLGYNIPPTRIGLNKLKNINDLEEAIRKYLDGKEL